MKPERIIYEIRLSEDDSYDKELLATYREFGDSIFGWSIIQTHRLGKLSGLDEHSEKVRVEILQRQFERSLEFTYGRSPATLDNIDSVGPYDLDPDTIHKELSEAPKGHPDEYL